MPGAALGTGQVAVRERGYGLGRFTRGGVKPALLLDGMRDKAYVDGARTALNGAITTGAGGVRTGFNVAGDLVDFPAGRLRRVKDLVQGAAIRSEAGTQNLITGGAIDQVALGTGPSGVTDFLVLDSRNGVTREVVATGVENGIRYADIRWYGTENSGSTLFMDVVSDSSVPVTAGESYTISTYLKVLDETTAAGDIRMYAHFRDAVAAAVGSPSSIVTKTGTLIRSGDTYAVPVGATQVVNRGLFLRIDANQPVDVTLRIGLPQFEPGDHVSSPVKSAGAISGRPADVLTLPLGSWFTPGQGTILFKGVFLGASGGLDRLFQLGVSGSDCMFLYYEAALSRLTCGVNVGGVWQGGGSAGAYSPGAPVSCAMSWNGTQVSVSLNGAAVQDFAVSAMPALTDPDIGHGAGADDGSQLTQLLAFWPQVDADLQGLSSWAM
jgi:hypothetical protein